MANYRLTAEQRRLKIAAREFAQEELLPIATHIERASEPLPRNVLELMSERGFMGLDIPAAYGGLGLDTLSCAIILISDRGFEFNDWVFECISMFYED